MQVSPKLPSIRYTLNSYIETKYEFAKRIKKFKRRDEKSKKANVVPNMAINLKNIVRVDRLKNKVDKKVNHYL